jgi:hypothetical protein
MIVFRSSKKLADLGEDVNLHLVYELYGLTEEEIRIVEGK